MAQHKPRPQTSTNGKSPHEDPDLTAEVVELFLRFGLNHRAIDQWKKLSSTRGGKSSQEILALFGVTESVKCAIIGCSQEQFDAVLSDLRALRHRFNTKIRQTPDSKHVAEVAEIINKRSPETSLAKLRKYKGILLTARDAESFHDAVNGEVRNLTQAVFGRLKQLVGCCQYEKCTNNGRPARLDTAHIGLSRPEIFKSHAVRASWFKPHGTHVTFDMHASMLAYLRAHAKKHCRVRFLCTQPCHQDLEARQKSLKKKGLTLKAKARLKKKLEAFTARIA